MSGKLHFTGLTVLAALLGAAWLPLSSAAYGQTGATAEHQAVLTARSQVAAAQMDAGRSSTQLGALASRKRQEFNASPDMVAATAAHQSAQSAYDAAKAKVRQALSAKPEYLAAVAARATARRQASELRRCGSPPDARLAAAEVTLAAETALTKMEDAAIDADAETHEAKIAASAAATTLAGLRRKFEDELKTDPEMAAARATLDAASAAFRAAQAQLSAATRAESAALAAAQPAGTLTGPYIFTGGNVNYVSGVNFTPGAIGGNITTRVIQYGTQLVVTNAAATR